MKLLLWGTGQKYRTYRKFILNEDIIALVDNDSEKWGKILDGNIVISPKDISRYEYDYIVILNNSYEEIRKQIMTFNINLDKVIDEKHNSQIKYIVPQIKYETFKFKPEGKKIAVVSHTLNRTGAPIVLKNMVEILKKHHYDVEVFSLPGDGLVNEFLNMDVSVTFLPGMYFDEDFCKHLFHKYDLVIVNTLLLHKLVGMLDQINKKVLWWLHEEEDYMKEMLEENIIFPTNNNVEIYAVSSRVSNAVHKYFPNVKIYRLPYGIKDNMVITKYNKEDKLIVAIIGTVCERKGQDVLLKAVDSYLQEKIEVWVIGEISEKQRLKFKKNKAFKVLGELPHEKILELYNLLDVVVCPSLNDPLPVVIAEAMQHKKLCIVSDMTGMAEFIQPYKNGIVCKAGDSRNLRDALIWILDNRYKIESIGEAAFQIYKDNFSMEAFENRSIKIVDKLLRT